MTGYKTRILIVAALATYLGVVGCVMWPTGAANRVVDQDPYGPHGPRVKLEGLPLRGVALQVQSVREMEAYKKAVDDIAATGADSIELVVAARMEHGGSTQIFLDLRNSPTPEQLAELIARAKQHKLKVMLMPIVLLDKPRGNEVRGTIKPESGGMTAWDEWFESYRQMMEHFAIVAEKNKVDLLVVGSELVSTEAHAAEWTKTIKLVRNNYRGMLTYSSNWDHYSDIPFWEQLDIIGMNSYWKMGENRDVSVEKIVERWRDIQKELMAFSRRKGKPIILVEVGWCSMANAAHEPWDYTKPEVKLDLDLQRKLYEGFFQAWYGNPNMAGFMIWEWEPFNPGGPESRSYTFRGKPAAKVLREWFDKGPWEVQ